MSGSKLPKRTEPGTIISGYELVRRIGRGGMAEVWFAHRALGAKGTKSVALKLIADHFIGDERYTRMFQAEAELAAVLSHANIVQVFDEGIDNGRSYLVMEWVDGLNLLKLGAGLAMLDDEDRRFRVISYIIGQLLYALGYAHSITTFDGSPLGVVHRDVSPQNVLVSNQGEVKLTDFGVAYHVMEESSGMHVKGKVRYMSPEQLAGKTRAPTVDLYAVGALLHELLDGKKFRGEYEDGQEMFTAVLSGAIPTLTRRAPPELDALRVRLLARAPEDRPQSAEEAIDWLKHSPHYGDARDELTKLCRNETGIVRPRVGPGLSVPIAMADRRTIPFKGHRGLAKPLVNATTDPRRSPPPPPPLRKPDRGPLLRTGSTTAVKLKDPIRNPEPMVVTGHTQLVQLPRPGDAPPPSEVAFGPPPNAALPETSPRLSGPAPAELDRRYASPLPHADPRFSPVPSHPHTAPSTPWVTDSPLTMSSTEGLLTPAPGASSARPAGTDASDTGLVVERGNNPTEEELRLGPLGRDGTDPSRTHLPPQSHSHSISITVRKRTAVAMVMLGLLLVAATSTLMVVLTYTQKSHREVLTSDQSIDARALPPKATLSTLAIPVNKDFTAPPAAGAADTERPTRGNDPDVLDTDEDVDETARDTPDPPDPPDPPATRPHELDDDPAAPTPADRATPDEDPAPAPQRMVPPIKRPKKALLRLSGVPTVVGYQVKVGSSLLTIPRALVITKKMTAGRKKVQWRRADDETWTPGEPLVLKPGKQAKLILTSRGLRSFP